MATSTVSVLEQRLREHPDSLAFSRLAEHYRKAGSLAEAVQLCLKGIEKNPDYLTGRLILGRCYLQQEKLDNAAEVLTQVCRKDRRNAAAIKLLADIFMRQGSTVKARALISLLSMMDPYDASLARTSQGARGQEGEDLFEILELRRGAEPSPAEEAAGDGGPGISGATVAEAGASAPKIDTSESRHPSAAETSEVLAQAAAITGDDISEKMSVLFGEKTAEAPGAPAVQETTVQPPPEDGHGPESAEPLARAAAITGDDISEKMSVLFGEKTAEAPDVPAVQETKVQPPHEQTHAPETAEPLAHAAPITGNDVSDKIADLFGEKKDEAPRNVPPVREPEAPPAALPEQAHAPEPELPGPAHEITGEDVSDTIAVLFGQEKSETPPAAPVDAGRHGPEEVIGIASPGESMVAIEEKGALSLESHAERTPVEEVAAPPGAQETAQVTGTDITERMAMIFGENEAVPETPLAQEESVLRASAPAPEESARAAQLLSEDTPSGANITSRIDELFGGKQPEAAAEPPEPLPPVKPAPRAFDKHLRDESFDLEETMIIDADDLTAPEVAAQSPEAGGANEQTPAIPAAEGAGEGEDATVDFFADEAETPSAASLAMGDELIIDEEESVAELLGAGEEAAAREEVSSGAGPVGLDEPISGDDVVERLDGIFGSLMDEARPPLVSETPGDGPGEGTEDGAGEATAPGAARDAAGPTEQIISGDDVERRIDEYFAELKIVAESPQEETRGGAMGMEQAFEETLAAAELEEGAPALELEFPQELAAPPAGQVASEAGPSPAAEPEPPARDEFLPEDETLGMEETLGAPGAEGMDETLAAGLIDEIEEDLPAGAAAAAEEGAKEKTAIFEEFLPQEREEAPLEPAPRPQPAALPPGVLERETPPDRQEKAPAKQPGVPEPQAAPAPEAPAPPPPPAPAAEQDKMEKPLDIPDHVLTPTLADIYFQQGQPQLAIAIYRRLSEKEPGNESMLQRIGEIEKAIAQGAAAAEAAAPPLTIKKKSDREKPPEAAPDPKKPSAAPSDPRPLAGVRIKKKNRLKWKRGDA